MEAELIVQSLELLRHQLPSRPQGMFSLLWIYKGTGTVAIDMERFPVNASVVFFVRPLQRVKPAIQPHARGILISFNRTFFERFETPAKVSQLSLLNRFDLLQAIRLSPELHTLMKGLTEVIVHEYTQINEFRAEMLYHFLKAFVIYLERQFECISQPGPTMRQPALVTAFFGMVEEHFARKKRVSEYARLLSISTSHLNKVLKEQSGFTASYYIHRRIVIEAKRQILSEGCSLKELSYQLGFSDPAHFSKFFKNMAGANFSDYKRKGLKYC